MGIVEIILIILCAFIMTAAIIYCWYKLSDLHIEFKSKKLYLSLFIVTIISALNFLIVNKYFRIILITTLLMFAYKFLYKESLHKSVLTPIYTQVLIFFAELIYLLIYLCIMGNHDQLVKNTITITVINNISVVLVLLVIIQFKFVKKIYLKFLKLTDRIGPKQLTICSLIGMLILNVLIMGSYYKIKFEYFIFINVGFIVFIMILIVHMFKTQNNYNKVSDKYNVAKTSLQDYETMMTKYRIANHENKNMLLAVRAMVINKEKNIPEYIDSLIENKLNDDEKLLFEMGVIPEGGLRATMYSEILKIKDKKINYNLSIDRKISTIDLIELDNNTTIDICKIIGVYIDNAIEATNKLKKKIINIDMYTLKDELCIKVSNNYHENIDISKINAAGYTTKEKGHGYGLSLVSEIINQNDLLENETNINKNVFSQTLKIIYKKNH